MKLRWGIMAPGGIASVFVQDLLATDRLALAVGSRSLARAQAFADRFGIKRAHGSYEALAEDPEIDAIYIASPHSEHAAHAELALRNGKHILVEKPFALTGAQARRIQSLARETGLFVMEAMRTRLMPHTRRIHEVIADGALGDIQALSADHFQLLNADPQGRLWNPELGGGALLDLGIYNVSFASDMLGMPSSVDASARMTATGVDLTTSMIFGYPSGAVASLQTGMGGRGPNRASIIGDKARIEIQPVFYKSSSFQLIDGKDRVLEDFSEPYLFNGKHLEAEEVERCVAAGLTQSPKMSLDETVTIAETLDRVREKIGLVYPSER